MHVIIYRQRLAFSKLPTAHQAILNAHANLLQKFDRVDDAIDANAVIARDIRRYVELTRGDYVNNRSQGSGERPSPAAIAEGLGQVSMAIRQLHRDWSAEGAVERHLRYGPVLGELKIRFGASADTYNLKVLVPGSGLGRLAYELALQGFRVEACDINIFQLVTSDFMLNFPSPHLQDLPQQYELYPFAHTFINQQSIEHQLKKVMVPDVRPSETLQAPMLNSGKKTSDGTPAPIIDLVLGDFTDIYQQEKQKAAFDIIVTVFFVDNAKNLLRYIDTINHCLKAGGVWINMGPLHWKNDFSSQQEDDGGCAELTHEEVVNVIKASGFVMEKQEVRPEPVGYMQGAESMMQVHYRVSLWVARKEE